MSDLSTDVTPSPAAPPTSAACPVDRMTTRRRNQICIAVLMVGLLNFVAYTLSYAVLGGDAANGGRIAIIENDQVVSYQYYVRGHFLRTLDGKQRKVSASVWIYSYLHSILLPITSAAMIISMLVLARPHIIATMRDGWISGATFITAFGTIVILVSLAIVVVFSADLITQLTSD